MTKQEKANYHVNKQLDELELEVSPVYTARAMGQVVHGGPKPSDPNDLWAPWRTEADFFPPQYVYNAREFKRLTQMTNAYDLYRGIHAGKFNPVKPARNDS